MNETLTEFNEEKQQSSILHVEINHVENAIKNYSLNAENKNSDKSKSCSSIETSSEKCDEIQKDSVLETRYSETSECDSSFKTDYKLSPKFQDIQKDSLLEVETQYTGNADDTNSESDSLKAENFDDLTHRYEEIEQNSFRKNEAKYDVNDEKLVASETSSSECQSDERITNVSDDEEIHVEYFEYVITNDIYDEIHTSNSIHKKSESELDLSKLHLSLREEESHASDRLKQVLFDIEKEIEIKSNVSVNNIFQDKSYQVCPGELALNMVDNQTQSTPPLSPLKKLAPAKRNVYTETDDSEIFSQYLISSEEQKLRQKLKEKENSLILTTIATQTEMEKNKIEILPAKQIQRENDSNIKKILIINDDKSCDSDMKLNVRQKIKIQNLDQYAKPADHLVKVTDQFYNLPTNIKTANIKSIDIQEDSEEKNRDQRSRSVSNSSTFIDLLSLNLDRSKTWVELTEAKLNYMIGETDAVLRSMNLDSSSEDEIKSNVKSLSINTQNEENSTPTPRKLINSSQSAFDASSYTSPRMQLISPNRSLNSLTSTTKTIEEMTQLYLDNYKRQLEDSRKELSSKMSLLEAEKEKIAKIRDSRKKELYMRRQAAIQAFKLERERELRHSFNQDDMINSRSDSVIFDDFDDDEFNQTIKTSKRLISDLPSQNREKLAKIRRNVVLSSSGVFDDSFTRNDTHIHSARVDEQKNSIKLAKNVDSRLLIPIQKTYIEETTETRIEHTTSSSSNSSSIIDESRLLLREYEQLRNDSVSEIQRAQDSLNASLLWLENQKQK